MFVRVRPELAKTIAELGGDIGSVLIGATCRHCDRVKDVEVRADGLRTSEATCPTCTNVVKIEADARTTSLTLAAPTGELAAYLEANPYRREDDVDQRSVPTSVSRLELGNVSVGNFTLLKRIGAGGMAEVFLARQSGPRGFERKVALKRIVPSHSDDEEFVRMFLAEARLAARLNHPNIIQVLDFGEAHGRYFLVMEYIEGWDLRTVLRRQKATGEPMALELACRIIADVCAALGAAHNHRDDAGRPAPIVHRDVSPHNILISKSGVVKLGDFGIAKAADSSNTESGKLKGKLSYCAPERVYASETIDVRSDVFSAGIVFLECLFNEHPFRRSNDAATLHAILEGRFTQPTAQIARALPMLDDIANHALAGMPDARYASATPFQLELDEYLAGLGAVVTAVDVAAWLAKLFDLPAPPSSRKLVS
jgi:serine/threonine protein kinase